MLQAILKPNSSGFTLIEVLVSILIMTVGLLGLLQTIILATEHNMRNQFRDEAVQIGEDHMHALKGKPFDMITAAGSASLVPSRIRGLSKNYTVKHQISDLAGDSKQLSVDVRWGYKNITTYHHQVVTVVSRQTPKL